MTRIFIIFIFIIVSCHKSSQVGQGQFLYFEGLNNKEALLSRVVLENSGKRNIIPLARIFTNTKVALPPGNYMLSNDCSSYEFKQEKNEPTRVFLSHLQLDLLGDIPTQDEIKDTTQVIQSLCYNVINQREYSYKNKVQFDILPGKTSIFISGKYLDFNVKPDAFENLSLDLISLSLLSSSLDKETQNFYIVSQSEQKKIVMSAPINGKVWLFPGQYQVEVNGTKKNIALQTKIFHKIQLGTLQVMAPKNFPFEKRMQL